MSKTIWTIGTQGKGPAAIVYYMRFVGAEVLVDVRANPSGQYDPCRQALLQPAVDGSALVYRWTPDLGVQSSIRNVAKMTPSPFSYIAACYEDMLRNEPVKRAAFDALVSWVIGGEKLALLCYEHAPVECHRRLLAELLASEIDGMRIVHL